MTQDAHDASKAPSDAPAKTSMSEAALRAYIDERFGAIDDRLTEGDGRMQSMEGELRKNTEITSTISDVLITMRSGIKVIEWLGKIAVPVVALIGLWHALTSGTPPQK